jgi:hypothetical protein
MEVKPSRVYTVVFAWPRKIYDFII